VTDIYQRAIDVWGEQNAYIVLAEECSEVATEALHVVRGRGDLTKLAEELADATIMINQAKRLLPPGRFDAAMNRKLERLEARVADAEVAQ
jgi:NTP pyrophosphatase (non-canonical NTP hydrolase)